MLFKYEALTPEGEKKSGSIEAANIEIAINSIQRRNLIVVFVKPIEKSIPIFKRRIKFFERVNFRDITLLSRQLSTLFESKVPVLDSLKLLASQSETRLLKETLDGIVEDIQGGLSLSQSMGKYPKVFSSFYVNMIHAGEESGKLSEIFSYLADYLEHSYELKSKARNALFYPAFVLSAFLGVMILMFVVVIPNLKSILEESGTELPIYTKIILWFSTFLLNYGVYILIALSGGIVLLWQYGRTDAGRQTFARIQISLPIIGGVFRKIFISRISESIQTLFSSGVPVVRSLEITANVVGNEIYKRILNDSAEAVKSGSSISEAFSKYKEIPALVTQMTKIGEESGKLGFILKTISGFYRKEVSSTLENLVSLIEPIMILVLGVGVGFLLIAVIGPIYNMSSSFGG